mgnify:CR=1 FL=1
MTLIEKINQINTKIQLAQEKSRYNHGVEIVGVTKTKPFSYIESSYLVGIRSIGENRVQEAQEKFGSFKQMPDLKKRFIGHLQSNKIRKCLGLFDTIDSVDSHKKLIKILKNAEKINKKISMLIEVNTSEEPQKSGFLLSQKEQIIRCFLDGGKAVNGLMTIGPNTKDKNTIRQSFKKLRRLKEDIVSKHENIKIKHLSMGMSGDYDIAVEEGSTMVRVGSFLYGRRN